MNFYIASGLKNWKQVKELSDKLENQGWKNTHNWAKNGLVSNTDSTKEDLGKISREQIQAIIKSDVVLIIITMGRGTHVELGACITLCELGLPQKIYLYSEDPEYFEICSKTAGAYHNEFVIQKTGDVNKVVSDIINDNNDLKNGKTKQCK